jgi:hypothetical protein
VIFLGDAQDVYARPPVDDKGRRASCDSVLKTPPVTNPDHLGALAGQHAAIQRWVREDVPT